MLDDRVVDALRAVEPNEIIVGLRDAELQYTAELVSCDGQVGGAIRVDGIRTVAFEGTALDPVPVGGEAGDARYVDATLRGRTAPVVREDRVGHLQLLGCGVDAALGVEFDVELIQEHHVGQFVGDRVQADPVAAVLDDERPLDGPGLGRGVVIQLG